MASEISLTELLGRLDRLKEKDFHGKKVDALLQDHFVPVDDLADYANFWTKSCARNLIHRTELYELILLAWLPGQKTRIHSHGGKRCWTSIVHGRLVFQEFAPFEAATIPPESIGPPATPPAGQMLFTEDALGMHSIYNPGPQHALSLHLYAGPLGRCRVWNGEEFEWKNPRYFTTPEGWLTPARRPPGWSDEEPPRQ